MHNMSRHLHASIDLHRPSESSNGHNLEKQSAFRERKKQVSEILSVGSRSSSLHLDCLFRRSDGESGQTHAVCLPDR